MLPTPRQSAYSATVDTARRRPPEIRLARRLGALGRWLDGSERVPCCRTPGLPLRALRALRTRGAQPGVDNHPETDAAALRRPSRTVRRIRHLAAYDSLEEADELLYRTLTKRRPTDAAAPTELREPRTGELPTPPTTRPDSILTPDRARQRPLSVTLRSARNVTDAPADPGVDWCFCPSTAPWRGDVRGSARPLRAAPW